MKKDKKNNDIEIREPNDSYLIPEFYEYRITRKSNNSLITSSESSINEMILSSPSLIKFVNDFKNSGGSRFVADLSKQDQKKLSLGICKMVGKNGLLAQLRDCKTGEIIKQIRLKEEHIPTDTIGSLVSVSTQLELNELEDKMEKMSFSISQIEQGQRNDRIGLFYSARQKYMESMCIEDKTIQKEMLISSIMTANDARMQMMATMISDIDTLANSKIKKKEKDELQLNIGIALKCINDCTMISAKGYSVLGEQKAFLSVLKSYQVFIDQAFLEKHKNGCTYAEIMHDNLNINSPVWLKLPKEIYNKIDNTIDNCLEQRISINNLIQIQNICLEESNKESESVLS